MTTDSVLDRLQVCNAEIAGIKRAWRLSPSKAISPTDLPCIYMLPPRGMTQPAPRTAPTKYLVTRRYQGVLLVAVATGAALDNANEGSKVFTDAVPFLDSLDDYYVNHPRLHTDAGVAELANVSDDVTIQDGGIVENITAPGGTFVGIPFALIIEEQRFATRSST